MTDVGLLLMRLLIGVMMLAGHGWGKIARLGADPVKFADPFGLGATTSLVLAIFAEVVCSALIITGALTRFAAIPLLITMLVAAFIIHSDDPWQKKEFALLYAIPALTLVFTGAGRFSLDGWLAKKCLTTSSTKSD
jgi:putative oxidoreductase